MKNFWIKCPVIIIIMICLIGGCRNDDDQGTAECAIQLSPDGIESIYASDLSAGVPSLPGGRWLPGDAAGTTYKFKGDEIQIISRNFSGSTLTMTRLSLEPTDDPFVCLLSAQVSETETYRTGNLNQAFYDAEKECVKALVRSEDDGETLRLNWGAPSVSQEDAPIPALNNELFILESGDHGFLLADEDDAEFPQGAPVESLYQTSLSIDAPALPGGAWVSGDPDGTTLKLTGNEILIESENLFGSTLTLRKLSYKSAILSVKAAPTEAYGTGDLNQYFEGFEYIRGTVTLEGDTLQIEWGSPAATSDALQPDTNARASQAVFTLRSKRD